MTNFPIKAVAELRGKKIGDTTLVDSIGGYHHPRGNHMLYVMRGGLKLTDVEWVELSESNNEFKAMQMDVLKVEKSRRHLRHRQYRQIRAGRHACAGARPVADDQRADADLDAHDVTEQRKVWPSGW